jgi:chemotaxis protein methyltransferase CheR
MPSEEVAPIEQRLVLDAIFSRYGYDFREYSHDSMKRRLQAAIQKTGTLHLGELQHRLLHEPEFFAQVLPCLTVKVTEMFRDPCFFRAIRTDLVPILRTYPQLKIWHAGCATGEEAYSMAILAIEEGLARRSLIYATDIDSSAIAQAREGVYSSAQLTLYIKNYELSGGHHALDDYLTRGYSRVAIRESVRDQVSFFQHDLSTDFALGEMHLILCRNVALYFTNPLRERVALLFADSLCPGGFLCLGASETIPPALQDQFEEFRGEHRIFRKRAGA